MKLIELTYTVGETGLQIPLKDLNEMGFSTGDTATVAFLSADGEKNDFREFLIYGDAAQTIQIPAELLTRAEIGTEEDIRVLCFDGNILITRAEFLYPEELPELLDRLTCAANLVDGEKSV